MDYKNIYYKIIENAKKEAENGNRFVGYFEKHHILPKSLGGTNDKENLVKLTAREHFICHWLLVKMYDKGSDERYKMLCALWRMNNNGSTTQKIHYINSRAYEALRIEFSKNVSKVISEYQKGENNSQFGTKWFTNRNTGESKKFKERPLEEFWVEGRNLFHGEYNILPYYTNKVRSDSLKNWYKENPNIHRQCGRKKKEPKPIKTCYVYSNTTLEKIKICDGIIPEGYSSYNIAINYYNENKAKKLWDEYHSGNYKSFREFCRITKKSSQPNLLLLFKNHIPLAEKIIKGRSCNNASNKNLVGVYE